MAVRDSDSIESLEHVYYVRNLFSAEKFIQMKRLLEGEGNVELSFLTEFPIHNLNCNARCVFVKLHRCWRKGKCFI